jgi:hypothetical protein
MKPRTKRILLWVCGVFLIGMCGIAWLGYTFLSPNSSGNRSSAIDCTLTWGRLAPFPASAQQFTITTEGSAFTRAFRVTFIAPPGDIEQWLQQSPGTRDTVPTTPSPGVRHFKIPPGGGAQWAEVTVDDTNHRVSIYVYWS